MRLILIPMLIGLALALQACSGSAGLVGASRPSLAAPDSYLTIDCTPPGTLPDGPMTQRDIERYWGRDRASLVDCGARHGGLVKYYDERDAALRGIP